MLLYIIVQTKRWGWVGRLAGCVRCNSSVQGKPLNRCPTSTIFATEISHGTWTPPQSSQTAYIGAVQRHSCTLGSSCQGCSLGHQDINQHIHESHWQSRSLLLAKHTLGSVCKQTWFSLALSLAQIYSDYWWQVLGSNFPNFSTIVLCFFLHALIQLFTKPHHYHKLRFCPCCEDGSQWSDLCKQ